MSLGFGFSLPAYIGSGGGFGAGAAMSEDFTTGNNTLDPRITFSRTSNATLTGSNGLIQYAPHNLLTYSEQFDNAAWSKANTTITANSIAAPNGTVTADKLVESTTTTVHSTTAASQSFSAGISYTFSVYVKAGERYRGLLTLVTGTTVFGSTVSASFNLQTETISPGVGGPSVSITSVGSGWYRLTISKTAVATATESGTGIRLANDAGATTYTGDGVSGFYIWGAQFNVDGVQSYNPTTVKNLLGYTQEFDNAAWTKSNSFIQTNLLTYSQDFDNAAWTKSNGSVTADNLTAPDNSTTGDSFTVTTQTAVQGLTPTTSFTADGTSSYTFSIYIKKATTPGVDFLIYFRSAIGAGSQYSVLNANTFSGFVSFSAGSSTSSNYSAVDAGDWWRFSITAGGIPAGSMNAHVRLNNIPVGATVGVWGAQLVQGTSEGNYQTTYGTTKAVQYTAPDGSLSADKLVENTASTDHTLNQTNLSLTSGTNYTISFYAKGDVNNQWVQLGGSFGSFGSAIWANFDLVNGAVGNKGASTTASITPAGNGWYRCVVVGAATATTTGGLVVFMLDNANTNMRSPAFTGDGTSGIYIWGAQLSDSASVDPYVYNPVAAPTAAAYYGPRFDYDPVTLAPKGLLIEGQRTNLLTYSQDFDNAAWTKTNATVTANATTAPDGTSTAEKLVTDTTPATTHYTQQVTTTTAAPHAFSVYAKAGEYNGIYVLNSTISAGVYFDIAAGTISSTVGAATGTITNAGNGWYRCSVVATATAALNTFQLTIAQNGSQTIDGDGTSGIYIWGAQLELGAFATTSYIPTVASQVTRAADSAIMQGANFSNWYNQNTGTVYAEASTFGTAAVNYITNYNDSTTSNRIAQYFSTGAFVGLVTTGGAAQATLNISGTLSVKHALAYATNDFISAANGSLSAADTSGTVPVLSQLNIGSGPSAASPVNGHIQRIAYYNRRLANSELQSITS